jgi:hypothetical protein
MVEIEVVEMVEIIMVAVNMMTGGDDDGAGC